MPRLTEVALGALLWCPSCALPMGANVPESSPLQEADEPPGEPRTETPKRPWWSPESLVLQQPERLVERPTAIDAPVTTAESQPGEFVVAPIPFFSEQIGWGLALGASYIFQFDPESEPSSASIAGMMTDNDSEAFVAAFAPSFAKDRWRLNLVGGSAGINYDFFGIGNEDGEDGTAIPIESDGKFSRVEALRAVKDGLYLGPRITLLDVETQLQGDNSQLEELLGDQLDVRDLQFGLHFQNDSRDNSFFPRKGRLADVSADIARIDAGSDFDYELYAASVAFYHGLDNESVLAWRLLTDYSTGDAPFFLLPTHTLRGYEAGRYRDRYGLGGEVELRFPIGGRFGGVVFGGLGAVSEEPSKLAIDDLLPSVGVGLRIRLTEENPIDYRIDIGTGADEEAILYLSAGQAF